MESHESTGAPVAQPALFDVPDDGAVLDSAGILTRRFGAPPFSVLDARTGDWAARKRLWHTAIGDRGESREATLWNPNGGDDPVSQMIRSKGIAGGASLLDPVLTELVLRWFAPARGHVLDPCAGDTVGGFVAGALGHSFTGIELRA
jgi:hypothetical protein